MSDKLSPRPDNMRPLYGWKELDERLQATLSRANPEERNLVIKTADFKMSAEEIQAEAEKQGYIVSYPADGFMRFD